jgi:hypothetical protein
VSAQIAGPLGKTDIRLDIRFRVLRLSFFLQSRMSIDRRDIGAG